MSSRIATLPAPRPLLQREPRSPLSVFRNVVIVVVVVAVLAQAYHFAQVDPVALGGGLGGIVDIVRRGLPPDWSVLGDGLVGARDTIDIAIIGTAAAMVASLPLAMLAAENTTPNRACYIASRGIIGVLRAIPDIVLALLFVTAVGLGPYPAVLGLGFHSIGILGRLYAEVIEDIDMGPVEALRMAGASRLQVYTHAVIPGVITSLIGVTLYRMDTNVRATLALGFVGGGGLGFYIFTSVELFNYHALTTFLLIMLALVLGVEAVAVYLRRYVR